MHRKKLRFQVWNLSNLVISSHRHSCQLCQTSNWYPIQRMIARCPGKEVIHNFRKKNLGPVDMRSWRVRWFQDPGTLVIVQANVHNCSSTGVVLWVVVTLQIANWASCSEEKCPQFSSALLKRYSCAASDWNPILSTKTSWQNGTLQFLPLDCPNTYYCNYSWDCLHMGASYLELRSPTPSAKSLEMLRFGRESGISSTWAHFLQGFWKTPAASCGIQNSNREWWGPNFRLFETAFAIVDVKKSLGRMHTTCYGNILEIYWNIMEYHNMTKQATSMLFSFAQPNLPHPRPSQAIPGPAGQVTQL